MAARMRSRVGTKAVSRGLEKGTGERAAPTRATGALSWPKSSLWRRAEISAPTPKSTWASWATTTRPVFLAMLMQGKKLPELVQAGLVKVEGDPKALGAIVANVVTFTPNFPVVTP